MEPTTILELLPAPTSKKPARISEHCAIPTNEPVQAPARSDRFNSGPQPKMIGVTQNDSRIKLRFKFFEANALDRPGGTHRHEHRRLNHAAARRQHTSAGLSVLGFDFETECGLIARLVGSHGKKK